MKLCKFILLIFLFAAAREVKAQLTYNQLTIEYDSAWQFKDLKLIPVKFKNGKGNPTALNLNNTISFEDAFRSGKISVHEIKAPQGSDIGVLEIRNFSKKNILVHSGDIITGGRQDRASAESMIIPPSEEKNYLQVFCVEKERWDDKSKPFTYGGMADAGLRKAIDIDPKQNKIWKEIDSQFQKKKIQSPTFKYVKLFNDSAAADSAYMNYFISKMKQSDSSFAGFIAVSGTRIINCELFGNTQLTLISYQSLLHSYVRSILPNAEQPSVSDNEVKNFLNNFLQSEEQQEAYAKLHGHIYRSANEIIHLVVYGE